MIKPNSINCIDVISGLKQIEPYSVDLIVTSPPFNVNIDYDNHVDTMPHAEYLSWMKQVWTECFRVLVDGGRICINIDATMNMEEGEGRLPERVHPLHVDFTNQLREIGYIYRAEIIWTKQNASGGGIPWGSYCSCSNPHIRRNTEYIIVASKNDLTLHGDPMMSDITKDEFHEWTLSEWKITPETKQKGHPVPYPRELVKRCVKLFSFVGNTVLDIFNGSGTTTTTACELGRQYIGLDLSPKYCQIAEQSVLKVKQEHKMNPYLFTPSPVLCEAAKAVKKANIKQNDLFSV